MDTVKDTINKRKVDQPPIPGGYTKYIQGLDVSWNRPFKSYVTDDRVLTSHGKPGKSADFLLKSWKSHGIFFGKLHKSWKSHGIYSLVPRIFSNRGGQFKGNSSN